MLGLNGAGKSTLLRIMAGLDTNYSGEAFAAKQAKVGYLPQEPQLDESKTVAENVMEGLADLEGAGGPVQRGQHALRRGSSARTR